MAEQWYESGDGHGYVYQYIGPIHYLCECGDHFLNRERWLAHKAEQQPEPTKPVDQVVVHVSDEEPCVLSELDYGDPVCIHGYATMLVWREVDPEPPC